MVPCSSNFDAVYSESSFLVAESFVALKASFQGKLWCVCQPEGSQIPLELKGQVVVGTELLRNRASVLNH